MPFSEERLREIEDRSFHHPSVEGREETLALIREIRLFSVQVASLWAQLVSAKTYAEACKERLAEVEASETRLAEVCEMLIEEMLKPSSDPEEPILKANRALAMRPDDSGPTPQNIQ